MKQIFATLLLSISISIVLLAQHAPKSNKNLFLTTSLSYGTENNWGNTGFNMGISIAKPINKRFAMGAGLTYFTTAIYNAYKANPVFYANEERYYNVGFLNLNAQYVIGNEQSWLNAKIKVGPGIRYHDFKMLRRAKVYYEGAGPTYEIVPGTELYETKNGLNLSLYSAISFDTKITPKLRVGVYLDTYSSLIFLEHFMPGIHATFKFGNKE
jgi:hypothetical protein